MHDPHITYCTIFPFLVLCESDRYVFFKIVISHLDLGEQSEISIRCNVLLNNAQAEPGNLIFKIGNEKLENDDNELEYDESKKVWYKLLNYKPDIYDNGEILKCVLNPDSNHEISETLNIHLYKFKMIDSGEQMSSSNIQYLVFT